MKKSPPAENVICFKQIKINAPYSALSQWFIAVLESILRAQLDAGLPYNVLKISLRNKKKIWKTFIINPLISIAPIFSDLAETFRDCTQRSIWNSTFFLQKNFLFDYLSFKIFQCFLE